MGFLANCLILSMDLVNKFASASFAHYDRIAREGNLDDLGAV